jgi:hypothetical protein
VQTDGCCSVCLPFAAGRADVCVYRGMKGQSEFFKIYLKSSVEKTCCSFDGEVVRFHFVAAVSTANLFIEFTPDRYSL